MVKKLVKKKPPEGFVNWSADTFTKLQGAAPEPLVSRFQVTHAMLLHVLSRGTLPVASFGLLLLTRFVSPATSLVLVAAVAIFAAWPVLNILAYVVAPRGDLDRAVHGDALPCSAVSRDVRKLNRTRGSLSLSSNRVLQSKDCTVQRSATPQATITS